MTFDNARLSQPKNAAQASLASRVRRWLDRLPSLLIAAAAGPRAATANFGLAPTSPQEEPGGSGPSGTGFSLGFRPEFALLLGSSSRASAQALTPMSVKFSPTPVSGERISKHATWCTCLRGMPGEAAPQCGRMAVASTRGHQRDGRNEHTREMTMFARTEQKQSPWWLA
jgi:hypothetical protein